MINLYYVTKSLTTPDEPGSNIFRAAFADDVEELNNAKRDGQTVNDIEEQSGMTAAHIAAWNGSANFLIAAVNDPVFDPWIRDPAGKTPYDYSSSRNDTEIMRALRSRMYPTGVQNPFPSN